MLWFYTLFKVFHFKNNVDPAKTPLKIHKGRNQQCAQKRMWKDIYDATYTTEKNQKPKCPSKADW